MRSAGLNKTGSPALQKKDVKTKNRQYNGKYALSPLVPNLPPLPPSEVTDPHDDITLPRLIEALQNRHTVRQRMTAQYNNTACTMKTRLQEIDISLLSKNNDIHEQNIKLAEKERILLNNKAEIEGLKKKTRMQEFKIGILENATKIYEDDKRSLQQKLDTIQQRLQRELSDNRHTEQCMQNVVTDTQLKLEKECDRRVNAVELEMQSKLWMREEKLRQLKAVVMEGRTQTSPPDPPPCQTQLKQSATEETNLPATRSASPSPPSPAELPKNGPVDLPPVSPVSATTDEESDINPRPTYPIPSPKGSVSVTALEQQAALSSKLETQSPAGASASRARRRAFCLTRENETSALDLDHTDRNYRYCIVQTRVPVHPLHCHPRCARGEKWVDHKPSSVVDLGTVLQPVIPNAIQVSSPSEKALSQCDRYVLTHQEVASDGEIQTQLFKGDVIKTRGGGQAVQFTDIETLKLELTTVPSYTKNTSCCETAGEDQAQKAWTDAEYHVGLEMKAGSNIGPGYGHQEIPK